MKAFLLAAGKGTRLQPLTSTVPKCLVPIRGVPLLEIWLARLEAAGVAEVLINLHHLADQVKAFLQERQRRAANNLKVVWVWEEVLLGSGGTIWANRDFVADEETFLIVYADNLTDMDLKDMLADHQGRREKDCVLTMGLFHTQNPSACGIAELDGRGKILSFVEKPPHPATNLANAGIYVASRRLFDFFPAAVNQRQDPAVLDLGHDVLPRLTGKMYGYRIKGYLRDIGTLAAYYAAQEEWPLERK